MPDGETSARFGLPYLMAGQAQKEITHNEALTLVDLALCPVVEAVGTDVPPSAPVEGQAWIVGSAPSGSWTGRAQALAGWTGGGWRFVDMPVGALATLRSNGLKWQRKPTGWAVPAAVPGPTDGTTIDTECRAALSALLGALVSCGLVAAS